MSTLNDFLLRKGFSDREIEISTLVSKGLSNKEIAVLLSIGEGTVKFHLTNIYDKLHVRSRTKLVIACIHYSIFEYFEQSISGIVKEW